MSRRSATASRSSLGKLKESPSPASCTLSLPVIAGTFEGRHSKFGSKTINIQCKLTSTELTLRTIGTEANFDLTVSCTVTDASITGNVKTNVIATPSVQVGFVGAELTVDPDYENQREECEKAAAKMFKDLGKTQPSTKVKIGDPVEFGDGVMGRVPVYARQRQFERVQRVVDLSRMAHAMLPAESARLLTASLVSERPGPPGSARRSILHAAATRDAC